MRLRIKLLIKVTKKIYKNEILRFYKNGYYLSPLIEKGELATKEKKPYLYFALLAPDGEEVIPIRPDGEDGIWKWSKIKVNQEKENIVWVKEKNEWKAYYRIYKNTLP